MDATTPDPTGGPVAKQRFEALTEGIYGIALTLVLAFSFPGWNMFGMLLLALVPAIARRSIQPSSSG